MSIVPNATLIATRKVTFVGVVASPACRHMKDTVRDGTQIHVVSIYKKEFLLLPTPARGYESYVAPDWHGCYLCLLPMFTARVAVSH